MQQWLWNEKQYKCGGGGGGGGGGGSGGSGSCGGKIKEMWWGTEVVQW